VGRALQLPSGRIIALGRLLLACLFLFGIWLEFDRSAHAPYRSIILAVAYLFFSGAILLSTWNDWWMDARLAGPAHALDIGMFTLLIVLTQGYTSPFFTFFLFLLMSAAVRWGWRATALTAVLVLVMYLLAGSLVVTAAEKFDLQRFLVRTGHLVILSLILIWFAIQWRTRFSSRQEELLEDLSLDQPPVEASLRASMAAVQAGTGAFVWHPQDSAKVIAHVQRHGDFAELALQKPAVDVAKGLAPFLYDLRKDRGLQRDSSRSLVRLRPTALVSREAADALHLSQGLAIPVTAGSGDGALFLEDVVSLSTDHLDLANQLKILVTAHMQRDALVRGAEESAAARSRLSLARDLHDSVVQFLAGAAFRLEAMRRAEASGGDVGVELDALKQLMLQEQGELRSFVAALRSGSRIAVDELAKDLRLLADRLSKQWDVSCAFSAQPGTAMVPTRLHLDAQQLVREAVANAVRHAKAKSIKIRLAANEDELMLEFLNDGAPYPKRANGGRMPQSLRERVEEAGGALDLSRGMGVTKVSIVLPISGARQ
jgi:signal transduction histidine kinase